MLLLAQAQTVFFFTAHLELARRITHCHSTFTTNAPNALAIRTVFFAHPT
jgi:hypothetical protein